MTILNAIILGLVQGVAEFLPISSSGHLAILQEMFGLSDMGNNLFFDVLLHMGTLIAICFVYWDDIRRMVRETLLSLKGVEGEMVNGRMRYFLGQRLFVLICIASLPLLLSLAVNDYIEQLSGNTMLIGIELILTGCLLYASDRLKPGKKTEFNSTAWDALLIGLAQFVGSIPGISRSGATITMGLATGHRRDYAVKFSLLMSIPAVLGATFLELIKAFQVGVDASLIPAYLVGTVVAMVTGVLAISILKKLAKKGGLGSFSYYCWLIGTLAIVLTFIV